MATQDPCIFLKLSLSLLPYSRKISRTINFTFSMISLKPQKLIPRNFSIECYDNLVDPQNLIRKINCGEIII